MIMKFPLLIFTAIQSVGDLWFSYTRNLDVSPLANSGPQLKPGTQRTYYVLCYPPCNSIVSWAINVCLPVSFEITFRKNRFNSFLRGTACLQTLLGLLDDGLKPRPSESWV